MHNNEQVYTVIVDPAASDRMYDHFEFLAQFNKTAAENLLGKLLSDIRSLEYMPYRNPIYNSPYITSGKYRYMVSDSRYRIVYQIENTLVFVDDIQDCRQSDNYKLI